MHSKVSAAILLAVGLCLTAGNAAAAPCAPEPTDMSVALGNLITCDTSPAADTDIFRFSATAGNRVLAEALFVSGASNYTPFIQLVAPDGTLLGGTWGPARLEMIVPQTGTYSVVVSALSAAAVGQYSVMVSCVGGTCLPTPPPPPAPPPGANVPCETEPTDFFPGYGTRVLCDITPSADSDLYRFSGSIGDRVLAEAVFASGPGNFTPYIELIAPNGTVLGGTWGPARLEMSLPQSGTYTVVVSALSAAASGQYTFTVSCLGGSCAPPPGQLPSLTLNLTGCTTCAAGNQFTVQAHFSNPATHSITAELKIGLRLPDGTPGNLLGNKHIEFPVPASLNVTTNLFSFPWPAGLPAGSWTIEAAMLGVDLGETYSRSVKTFTVVP
jgi:hypothetical protein